MEFWPEYRKQQTPDIGFCKRSAETLHFFGITLILYEYKSVILDLDCMLILTTHTTHPPPATLITTWYNPLLADIPMVNKQPAGK